MLRLILFILLFYFSLNVFSQNVSHQFVLNGRLSNLTDSIEKIFINYRVEGKDILDSSIVQNYSYTFKGKIDEPVLAILQPKYNYTLNSRFKETDYMGQAITIFLEPSEMEICNSVLFDSFKVENSLSDLTYQKLMRQAEPFYSKLQSLDKKYDTVNNFKEKEQIVKMRINIYQQMKDSVFYNYLITTPSTPLAIYILDFYFSDSLDLAEAQKLFKTISKRAQNSRTGQLFKRRLENAVYLDKNNQSIDFTQKDDYGFLKNLSSFRGRYVLLDFWASWCSPCRLQNPRLIETYNKFKKKGFEILSISLDTDEGKWKKAISIDKMNWVNLSDLKGSENSVALKYNVQSIPQNFLIDTKGKIIGKNIWGSELDEILLNIYNK